MKHTFTLLLLLLTTTVFSQREEIFNNCGTDFLPENINNHNADFENFYEQQIQIKAKNPVTYYIPVVFHVIHIGEPVGTGTNVSDIDIYNALKFLNDNFKNNHKHPSNSNTNIQFVLASKDPNGACSTGINRINFGANTTYVNYGNQYSATDNGVSAATIRALSAWNPSQYYNVWVINKITSATTSVGGYAYLADQHGLVHDGTFIMANLLKDKTSIALTHELGHSLNLHHTFQGSTGTNCPTQVNGCGQTGDCVSDTPPHIKNHTIDLNLTAFNNCSNNNDSSFKHNYMTYSKDVLQTVFTPMQVLRMQSALNFYRSSFLPNVNSAFNMSQAPTANFMIGNTIATTKQYVCANTPISLKNISSCFLNTFNETTLQNYSSTWTIKRNGQTVLTSNEPNPEITLTQPGSYSITLNVTNNIGSNSITKNDILQIVNPLNVSYCIPTSLNAGSFFYVISNVKIGGLDQTSSPYINDVYSDFSCPNIGALSAKSPNKISITVTNNNPSASESLALEGYIDYNKNGVFEMNEIILEEFVPSGISNKTYTYYFTPPAGISGDQIYRLRLISERSSITPAKLDCSAQFNIGDIEDYSILFTDGVLSVDGQDKESYKIYPNPATDVLYVSTPTPGNKKISIYDNSGKLIQSYTKEGQLLDLKTEHLPQGTYLLQIDDLFFQFIKK